MALEFDELLPPLSKGPCWWSSLKKFPTKIMDQHFGYELFPDDLNQPFSRSFTLPRKEDCIDQSGYSKVFFDDDFFIITFKSKQFLAKDLKVDFHQNSVTISGRHDYIEESEGSIYRSFERRYMLPVDVIGGTERDNCLKEGHKLMISIPRIVPEVSKLDA